MPRGENSTIAEKTYSPDQACQASFSMELRILRSRVVKKR